MAEAAASSHASGERLSGAAAVPSWEEQVEECALHGLSTTVANERLVEEVELIVNKFLEHVTAVTWRSRLSFLQTQEGAVTLLCCAVLTSVAAYTLDAKVLGEVLLALPFHFLAWYISFRLPRAEQLRAVAKVRECLQRFGASEDAFARSTRGGSGGAGSAGAASGLCCGEGSLGQVEAVPPSSFCVSVLRDRAWRQIPYNMVVEGDVFKLREGETFPCQAERLAVRPPHGAMPAGDFFSAGDTFSPASVGREAAWTTSVCSFRALSTACLPTVRKFLKTTQRASEGRMDTVFFELAALARGRLKKISLAAFLATAAASAAWMARPAVAAQALGWHLHRALLPFRLVICLLPLMPVILLQITDVWGNARIQSLFEWHAGVADGERGSSSGPKEAHPGSGEIDASRVPLQRQLRELLDILRQGLDGPSNLMHTLNSTTVVCFCDKEGLLTDTCTTIDEVCVCSSEHPLQAAARARSVGADQLTAGSPSPHDHEELPATMPTSPSATESLETVEQAPHPGGSTLQPIVLDVQSEPTAPSGLRFEDSDWRNLLPILKPLGLGMAVSRQPREASRTAPEGMDVHDITVGDLLRGMRYGCSAAMHDCLCNVSQLIGFKDEVLGSFADVKFCMEVWRPAADSGPSAEASPASAGPSDPSPGFVATHGRPHLAWRAAASPSGGSEHSASSGVPGRLGASPGFGRRGAPEAAQGGSQEAEAATARQPEDDPHSGIHGTTNFSQTLMSWFVQDVRDGSLQMFCKAKPKRLLPKCNYYFNGSKVVPLRTEDREKLMRLVLQWKASGLSAVAYSYRPLTAQAELDVAAQLSGHNFFCATEGADGAQETVEVGQAGAAEVPAMLASTVAELQAEQVLLGMAGVKLCASVQMASYAEALQTAGIRFQVYSPEGEKRTRTLGAQLGLETGWNCLISLELAKKEVKNMMGQVVLPSGIPNIRRHTKEVDNVPLLVSLYSKSSPWRAQQMISILQENAECVTCVGSALQPNFETFRQANISVSVLVGAVPQCRRCFGRREPRPGDPNSAKDLFVPSTVNRAEFQLSADLTSLPCALQARHSYSNGEQRTLGVLFNALKEARRCVDCILMVLIHYICGAVELAVIVALQALLCLPAPLEGLHVFALLFVLLPTVSLALLFNAASPQLMKELPLKKADEKTLAQPGRLMLLYALRSVPTALVVISAFAHDLHRVFEWQLGEARRSPGWAELAPSCEGFSWLWWVSGRWPRCAAAMSRLSRGDSDGPHARLWLDRRSPGDDVRDVSCALVHAQQWGAFLFVLYEVALAFTFLDRYDSLLTRGPLSNKVLCSIAAFTLLVHGAAGWAVVVISCGHQWHEVLWPRWEVWAIYVGVWPLVAIAVSECTKRRDRRYHVHLQKTLRVLFNTRLGMWSPK